MKRAHVALAAVAALAAKSALAQQQLGTKIMGGLGIDAGVQSPPGVYVLDRVLGFDASKVRDRNGATLPITGLDISARANAIGAAYTFAPRSSQPYLTVAAGMPLAHVSVNSDEPFASVDAWGFGDVFLQPVKVGWRQPRYDAVVGYDFFAPTGKFEPRRGVGVGRGYWTHQFSVGGALFADTTRALRASALMSYDLNEKMRGIDITRGNMLDVQGGAGVTIRRIWVIGVAGYALRQVSDDRGADLPPRLTGARARTYGLGPEVDVVIPSIGTRAEFRYQWDFGTRARPQGQVFAVGLSYLAWTPAARAH